MNVNKQGQCYIRDMLQNHCSVKFSAPLLPHERFVLADVKVTQSPNGGIKPRVCRTYGSRQVCQ